VFVALNFLRNRIIYSWFDCSTGFGKLEG